MLQPDGGWHGSASQVAERDRDPPQPQPGPGCVQKAARTQLAVYQGFLHTHSGGKPQQSQPSLHSHQQPVLALFYESLIPNK